MKKRSRKKAAIRYSIGNRKKEHSLSVDEIIKRFSESKEADNYTRYSYPFNVCMYRFLIEEIKGIQKLDVGQFRILEDKFNKMKQ